LRFAAFLWEEKPFLACGTILKISVDSARFVAQMLEKIAKYEKMCARFETNTSAI